MPSRLREDLRHSFGEQLRFLDTSRRAFDAGETSEAKRIAVVLRTLLHDTATAPLNGEPKPNGSSHALMVQLGWRDDWGWADTAGEMNHAGLLPISNLAPARFSAKGIEFRYRGDSWRLEQRLAADARSARPFKLRPPGYFLPFRDWWTMPVIRDSSGEQFSRFDLVRLVTNKDGGVHVDPKLPDTYFDLHSGTTFGWKVTGPDGALQDVRISPVLTSLRQIAEELALTLQHHWTSPEVDPLLNTTSRTDSPPRGDSP